MNKTKTDADALQQVGNIWKFLDAMSLANPDEYKRFVDQVLKDGSDNNMGPPIPQMVIQTTKQPEVIPVRKYYINIAEWRQMPKPESEAAPIPIASSEIRKEVIDKEWGFLVDVVLNPMLFKNSTDTDACLIEMVLKYIESKESLSLSRKYERRSEKYVGNQDNLLNFLCPSALKNSLDTATNGESNNSLFKQLRHISNTSESEKENDISKNNNNIMAKEQPENSINSSRHAFEPIITANVFETTLKEEKTRTLKQPARTLRLKTPRVEMLVNKDKKMVELDIYLPEVQSVNDCDLDLTETSVLLKVEKKYELNLTLPVTINVEDSKAKFVRDRNTLVVSAPLVL